MHAEVRIGDTVIMIADSVDGWRPVASSIHVYAQDVDATYQLALAAVEAILAAWIATAQELGRPIPTPKGRLRFA